MPAPGMAGKEALEGEPAAFEWAMLFDGFQPIGAAGGRERPRHGEQHHFLALEDLVGGDLLRPVGPRRHQLHRGNAVAHFDCHAVLVRCPGPASAGRIGRAACRLS